MGPKKAHFGTVFYKHFSYFAFELDVYNFIDVCLHEGTCLSTVATSRSSIASTVADNITDSNATVGADASSLLVVLRCFWPSAHPRALTLPHRFFDTVGTLGTGVLLVFVP
jgi:hypothetical protein